MIVNIEYIHVHSIFNRGKAGRVRIIDNRQDVPNGITGFKRDKNTWGSKQD
jgi:hypothetical protein